MVPNDVQCCASSFMPSFRRGNRPALISYFGDVHHFNIVVLLLWLLSHGACLDVIKEHLPRRQLLICVLLEWKGTATYVGSACFVSMPTCTCYCTALGSSVQCLSLEILCWHRKFNLHSQFFSFVLNVLFPAIIPRFYSPKTKFWVQFSCST